MILKLLLVMGLAFACQTNEIDPATCEKCYNLGTYKCGHDDAKPCICHLGYFGYTCNVHSSEGCDDSWCNGGTCNYRSSDGRYECICPEGYWGRQCEHLDSEVANITNIEKRLVEQHCKGKKECEPEHLKFMCSSDVKEMCDDNGNMRPFKKCPYPWYCYEQYRNGKCDWECERKECLYDGYDCARRSKRGCNHTCVNETTGVCDAECDEQAEIEEWNSSGYGSGPETIEISLSISEIFWWNYTKEIIANISGPLRTIVEYVPDLNEGLEKRKRLLGNGSWSLGRSRARRSISRDSGVVVYARLITQGCVDESSCAPNAQTAISQLAVTCFKNKSDGCLWLTNVRTPKLDSQGRSILAVCVVVIAVPIVLIGYRIVSAPIWFPPKSEKEAPVVWVTKEPPVNPFNYVSTYLHEEAYSIRRISLPIRSEYVNRKDEQGRTPLFWLISSMKDSQSKIEDLDELMKAGANPNHSDKDGETPLSIGIRDIRPSICVRLVQWGANPTATNYTGSSCLHLAVGQGDVKCVQWLLHFPAVRNNINEVDDMDRTPLAITAQGGETSAQIAEILIEEGADVLHQGDQNTMWRYRGRSALHWAAQFNNLEVMQVLLSHRSDVNCVDTEGCTALHFAVQRGSEAAVRMLLEAHASTEIADGLGALPLSIANASGIEELIELIKWYSEVRKVGLAMKKKEKRGTKREKGSCDWSGDYSKRSCPPGSPFYCDSLSSHSDSVSSASFFPSTITDSSSIGSGTSMTSSSSSNSSHSASSCPWSPSSSISSSSLILPSKSRPPRLPSIQEKPIEHPSYDFVYSEEFVYPDEDVYATTVSNSENVDGEDGLANDLADTILLSPYSEISNDGRRGSESPVENLGTNYWNDSEKAVDGFDNELLQEFFVDWPN